MSVAYELLLPNMWQWWWGGIDHNDNKNFTNGGALVVVLSYETLTG